MAGDKEIQEGKIFAVIGYLWILCFIPLIFKKDNKFALFHAKQGLVLFIGEIATSIIMMIPLIGIIAFLVFFVLHILMLIGIIQALIGNYWRMPIVADLADKINL